MDYRKFMRLLISSKQYEMDCEGHLTITDYYTGERVTLDLTQMDEEIFEQLTAEDDEDEEDDYDEEI